MANEIPKPKKCIQVEEARDLQKNWCNTRSQKLHKKMGFEDTRDFWWSVEELEEYLAYVKQESTKQGIKDPGIRFHLGSYSPKQCKMNRGYTTLFMAPTGTKPGARGKDGDGGNDPNYNIAPYNFGELGNPPKEY